MRKDKSKSAKRLFDAMDMIDDRIIAEAAEPYVKQKKSFFRFTKVLALACSLVICVSVGLGVILSSRLSDDDNVDMPNADNAVSDTTPTTLAEYLFLLDEKDGVKISSSNEIDLFDGTPMLIWRFEGDEPQEYRTLALCEGREKLESALEKTGRELSYDESQTVPCQVWISYGNGEVISPYLKVASGNVGYGEIFEYSPECEPNYSVVTIIDRLAAV